MDNKLFLKAKERAEQRIKVIDGYMINGQCRASILDQYVDYEYRIAELEDELRQSARDQIENWGYYQ